MQATFKIYRVAHDPVRNVLVLAGKALKGTVRTGMKVLLELETQVVTEFKISDIEMVGDNGTYLFALVLAMSGRDVAAFLERRELVGASILVSEIDQE